MDPQAALYDLIDSINRNDRQASVEYLESLKTWIENGGFLPEVFKIHVDGGMYQIWRK